jgi:hypothetical protein
VDALRITQIILQFLAVEIVQSIKRGKTTELKNWNGILRKAQEMWSCGIRTSQ